MIDRGPTRAGRQIWISRGHLAALGTATFFIALLAFMVGLQVGRTQAPAAESADVPPTILPDPDDEDALEKLLREVEYAKVSGAGEEQHSDSKRADLSFPDALRGTVEEAGALGPAQPEQVVTTAIDGDADGQPPTPDAIPPDQPAGGWAVQVAAYRDPADAAAKVAELTADGLKAYQIAAYVDGETWYRVRIGGFEDRDQASAARTTLAERLGSPDLLVAEAP